MKIEINKLVRAKRRTIALIIERDGSLTVRAPRRALLGDIEQFIHEKSGWILRTQEKLKSIVQTPKKEYFEGEQFLFLGNPYELRLVAPQRPALKFDQEFQLGITAQKRGEAVFTKWYKQQAFQVISERVSQHSKQYNFMPKQVKISSAKTRWGSCSPDGILNFTWRLIMAPLPVVDYVVIHELVHLQVKNHSQKFWKAVEAIMPEYKIHRKWLRENGDLLGL
jgi:predicted metal-dependent hydrolase